MKIELAQTLYLRAKAHSYSACLLYRAAREEGITEGIGDGTDYAFNGTCSLSINLLLCLGLELYLKAAIVGLDPSASERFLATEIRHNLNRAYKESIIRGFVSEAPHLQDVVELLTGPYQDHYFRYLAVETFQLPGNFDQIVDLLCVLDTDVAAILGR